MPDAAMLHAAGEPSLALVRCDEASLHSIGFFENRAVFFLLHKTAPRTSYFAGGEGCCALKLTL
eukprot:scaffold3072_cov116-Isochrysis_galbana.AAC.6